MTNKKEMNNASSQNAEQKEVRWVLVAVNKKNILAKAVAYYLIKVGNSKKGVVKTFISTKFLRRKESDECVFFSLPEDMYIRLETSTQTESGAWASVVQKTINPWTLRSLCRGDIEPDALFEELPF